MTAARTGTLTAQRIRVLLVLVCVAALLAALGLLLRHFEMDAAELEVLVASLGFWGPVIVVALMIAHAFLPFPAELVAVAAGACFGTLEGALWVWTGAMIGAVLSFALARRYGLPLVESVLHNAQRERLRYWTEERGALALLVCRLVPIVAFTLVNYAAGLTRVSVWTFVWTTGLGILPLTLLMTFFGARMIVLEWPVLLAVSGGCLAVIAGVVIWRRCAARRGA